MGGEWNTNWCCSKNLTLLFFQPFSLQGDLNTEGDRLMVAKGGHGGSLYSAFEPSKGQANHIRLDLKLIADLGLVGWEQKHTWTYWLISADTQIGTNISLNIGFSCWFTIRFPNAGKSSLLTALSNATPQIASYACESITLHTCTNCVFCVLLCIFTTLWVELFFSF